VDHGAPITTVTGTTSDDSTGRTTVALLTQRARRQPMFVSEIPWEVPLNDDRPHMPMRYVPTYGTPKWESWEPTDRTSEMRRYCAELFTGFIWLENTIIHFLVRQAFREPPGSEAHTFLLVEATEECQHSLIFGDYVQACGVTPRGPVRWTKGLALLMRLTATDLEAMIASLIAELLTDPMNRQMAGDDTIHPTLQAIARMHVADEARHIAFAKGQIRAAKPSALRRLRASVRAPLAALTITRVLAGRTPPRDTGSAYRNRTRHDLRSLQTFLDQSGFGGWISGCLWTIVINHVAPSAS